MNVKQRILAIELMNKTKENPKYAKEIGLSASMKNKNEKIIFEKKEE